MCYKGSYEIVWDCEHHVRCLIKELCVWHQIAAQGYTRLQISYQFCPVLYSWHVLSVDCGGIRHFTATSFPLVFNEGEETETKWFAQGNPASKWLGCSMNLGLSDSSLNSSPVFHVWAEKGVVVPQGSYPRSAGLNRAHPAVEFLNRDAEGKGEALIFQTNDFGTHKKRNLENWQHLTLCANTRALFPSVTALRCPAPPPMSLEKGQENFRGTVAPKAVLLWELLVFTFQNVKSRGGIHTTLSPSRVPADFWAQKC